MQQAAPDKKELFETMPVMRAIFSLTIPMIVSSIVSIIYNLADTYFVGMLNDPVQNSAVTLTAPAMVLFYAVTNLFGVGASSLMSRSLGVKDYVRVKKASATGIYAGLLASVLLSAVVLIFNTPVLGLLGTTEETYAVTKQYLFWTVGIGAVPGIMNILFSYLLRAEGEAMHASIGTMSGCIINIILDPFFILPSFLNMGAAGAGMATFLSSCFACAYFLVYLLRRRGKSFVCLNPRFVSFEKGVIAAIMIVGIPGVFQNLLNVVSMTIFNNLTASCGTTAVAALGIVMKVNQLPVQIIFGFSQGVMPLIGYNYASGNHRRMIDVIKKTFIIMISTLVLTTLVYAFFGGNITRFFMDNEEIARIGALFFAGLGLSFPFMCVDFMTVGISQSFGFGRHALIFSILRKACFEIPALLILFNIFGLYGMPYAQVIAEVLLCVISIFVLKGLLKEKKQ